jgi:hypothetical protein
MTILTQWQDEMVPKSAGSLELLAATLGNGEPNSWRPGREKALKAALNLREGAGVIS